MNDTPQTLADALAACSNYGERVAFQDETRSVTFFELTQRTAKLVSALQQKGLKPGDRIALLSKNSVSAVECIFTASAGFILVPLNWRLAPAELNELVKDCAPSAFISDRTYLDDVDTTILKDIDIGLKVDLDNTHRSDWIDYDTLMKQAVDPRPVYTTAPSDPALIIYTSGTTGTPKGVTIGHDTLLFNMQTSGRLIVGASENDRSLMAMPMFHVGGLCFYMMAGYLCGTTTVLLPQFDIGKVAEAVRTERITNIHLVPTMISDLISRTAIQSSAQLLKRIMYAGSTMPVTLLERAMATFPSSTFVQAYGSTEGGSITTLGTGVHQLAVTDPSKHDLLKSCGQPLPHVSIRVTRNDGSLCNVGEPGEISVRSQGIMHGYWNKPDQTRQTLHESYLYTGDIGYFDKDGYLYLIDRKNDMIVTGGENVFPAEVEQVLYRCPDIAEAAVFGVPDAKWIEKVVAAVRLKEGSTQTEAGIIAFIRQHLTAYKCPKQVIIVPELPRTGVGKVSRKTLKKTYGSQQAKAS